MTNSSKGSSLTPGSLQKAEEIIDIMESAVTLKVPNKVDYEQGKNWGDIK